MKNAIVSMLIDLLKSLIENKLGELTSDCRENKKISDFLSDIEGWCEEFIANNEHTILSTSSFYDYVQNYKMVNNIINFVYEPITKNEEVFLKECFDNATKHLLNKKQLTVNDKRCIREFIDTILSKTKTFFENEISIKDVAPYYKINQIEVEVGKIGNDIKTLIKSNDNTPHVFDKKLYHCPENMILRKFVPFKELREKKKNK